MLFDKKLDIEHLYAGKKICFVNGDLNLEIREKCIFFKISSNSLFSFGSKTETKFQSVLNTQCGILLVNNTYSVLRIFSTVF